jgi:Secretion system C-terminal sorting domain
VSNINDKRTEVAYLQQINTPESPKFVGVIMNRTWNFFTVNGTQCDVSSNDLGFEFEKIDELAEVGWHNERLEIPNVEDGVYTIRYYDPYSLTKVNEEIVESEYNGDLDLLNYPLMFDGTSNHQPFYFFVAFKEGSEWNAMPENENQGTETHVNGDYERPESNENDVLELNTAISEKSSNKMEIYPNPTNGSITIRADFSSKFKILDGIGSLQMTGEIKSGNNSISLDNLANGVYTIEFIDLNQSKKIVKLQ